MNDALAIDRRKGFVRIYRKMIENPLFTDKPAVWFKIWVFVLLRANWKESIFRPRQGNPITVPAGSMITSLEKLATHAATSKEHARRCLTYLKKTHAVTLVTTHHWTMITVLNWAAYQQLDEVEEHTEGHTEEHAELRLGPHAATQQRTHAATLSKEVKNLSKKYKSNSKELDGKPQPSSGRPRKTIEPELRSWFESQFWPLYPRHEGKVKALEAASSRATTTEKRQFYLDRLRIQLPAYAQRKIESGQRVIPMASTWFNQDRAEDELVLAPEAKSRVQRGMGAADDYPEYVSPPMPV